MNMAEHIVTEICILCAKDILDSKAVKCYYCEGKTHWRCSHLTPTRLAIYVYGKCQFRCEQCAIKQVAKHHQNPNEAIEFITEELRKEDSITNQNSNDSSLPPTAEGPPNPSHTPPLPNHTPPSSLPHHTPSSPPTPSPPSLPSPAQEDGGNTPFSTPTSSPLQAGRPESATSIEHDQVVDNINTLIESTRNKYEGHNLHRTRICKYFMRNKCRFSQDECKYLHKIEHKNIICKFYKEGICKYANCAFLHPPFCKAFLENKNARPNGCFREGCQLFHPKLCHDLERQRDCLRKNCRFYHRTNAYYQGKKWTDDKVNESRAMHETEGYYDNASRWYDTGSEQQVYVGARPKTNNQHSEPAYTPVPDPNGNWKQNQNNWQIRNSYSSKLKSGIPDNRENGFLWHEMVQAFRDVQRLLQDRHMALSV